MWTNERPKNPGTEFWWFYGKLNNATEPEVYLIKVTMKSLYSWEYYILSIGIFIDSPQGMWKKIDKPKIPKGLKLYISFPAKSEVP